MILSVDKGRTTTTQDAHTKFVEKSLFYSLSLLVKRIEERSTRSSIVRILQKVGQLKIYICFHLVIGLMKRYILFVKNGVQPIINLYSYVKS